ncbi:cupin domain-containing protein [Basidiobolus meristosporus CBS 931.73]|uniref:Cupin domain-containing protein n=1 Tax=Basidiobolus meristosporus CBS 931.73 TaxID=1314790 RepID=A0A1Y1Y0K1_9FUNG|nr:cupin domain-containing protein [Basidiobolus meristosporus CBS 931.73]|eukprot:ORX91246.1 cupin domain-containing protein [Basidiobolus meristosporus CBS 931.73]
MSESSAQHTCLLKASEIAQLEKTKRVHPLNSEAVRHTVSLGDMVGMTTLGVHHVTLKPGDESTTYHTHHMVEEFLFVISGRGRARIGSQVSEVGPGDFMGFSQTSAPHTLTNPFDEDLVYLVSGTRLNADVVDYPDIKKRLFCFENQRNYVNMNDIDQINQ